MGYMVLTFLLPLVVALALFYLIPAGKSAGTADVEGTLYGLKIKAGGALAGYVIVLLFAIPFTNARMKEKEEENAELRTANAQLRVQKETWRVLGQVELADSAPEKYQVAVIPPKPYLDSYGKFDFNLRVPPKTDQAGPLHIPEIVISRVGYKPVSFRLDPDAKITAGYSKIKYTVNFDKDLREIHIGPDPIELEAANKEPYNPTQTLPSPLPLLSPSPSSSPFPGN